jgi:uncharacterized protein (DUF2235 family)
MVNSRHDCAAVAGEEYMGKNIVILFDGTSNEISSNRTNILRLFGCLQKDAGQVVFYSPGVGTFGAANSWSYHWRKLVELAGMATGWGIDQTVKEAYRFLVAHYDKGKGGDSRDRIYIFGFSRGAYTARVLAGFLNCFGLMKKDQLNLLDYAFRAYKAVNEQGEAAADWAEINLYERMLQPDHPPIRCLGLFDTVASAFEWGRHGPRFRLDAATSLNPSVEAVRHAVAIDERRSLYQPVLWPGGQGFYGNRFKTAKPRPQDVRELWFTGFHCDVGGGLPEADSALAKVPLVWMLNEVAPMGLELRETTVAEIVLGDNPKKAYVPPDPKGCVAHVDECLVGAGRSHPPPRAPARPGLATEFSGSVHPAVSPQADRRRGGPAPVRDRARGAGAECAGRSSG